ncbi:MAG: putative minor coat protein [Inoviridae sp.]|uniref:DUF2523 family protein n=1 Tax=Shewanella sp. SG41-3 TaxID=2760977 RepID=UPI000E294A0F|nr:DUF2523 family protein [Shewanella sp. SG41-3]AXH73371.1 MAG: putative minor coat protein [Inoviridae sp.]MBB1477836.1 DUF2523 domain-containing protein [Shewanella sp. SG41-3]
MLDWLAARWNEFVDYLYQIFISLVDLLKDLLFFVIDSLFAIVLFFLDMLGDLFTGLNPLQYFSLIPPETQYYMAVCGFNESMSMIVSALIIRMFLQLIPFVRLGS